MIRIRSIEEYLEALKEYGIEESFTALRKLRLKSGKPVVVRRSVAEELRKRYNKSARAFYGANRDVQFEVHRTLDEL